MSEGQAPDLFCKIESFNEIKPYFKIEPTFWTVMLGLGRGEAGAVESSAGGGRSGHGGWWDLKTRLWNLTFLELAFDWLSIFIICQGLRPLMPPVSRLISTSGHSLFFYDTRYDTWATKSDVVWHQILKEKKKKIRNLNNCWTSKTNLTIRALLAPRLKLFFFHGPKGPHVPAKGFVTIFPQVSAIARENRPIERWFSS